jgi:uncharacterized protein YigE (DUF2233 family)
MLLVRGMGALLLVCALGCNLTRTTVPDVSPLPPTTVVDDSPWQAIVPGIEHRKVEVQALGTTAVLVRCDPAFVTFQVHYAPGQPYGLDEWRAMLPGAVVILNAGFFNELYEALGLLVSSGQTYGQSYEGFGGMFQVSQNGVRVRSLVSEPYRGEPLWQAVQAFPMLVEAGGIIAPQGAGFDDRSRRTAVGQDRNGRIVFVIFPYGRISLDELQNWLLASDLDLHIAVALDGGRSTGMLITTPDHQETYSALDRLPAVVAVYLS